MLPGILTCAFVALTAPGFIVALRALPTIERRMMAGLKPWACDVCMSFWTVATFTTIAAGVLGDWRLLVIAGPAYTVCLGLLGPLQRSHTTPPFVGFPPEFTPEHGLAETLEPKHDAEKTA